MPSSFLGIEIGQRGLVAAQLGQDVTGHNIANASTPGYSVQRADFQTSDPLSPGGHEGGVKTGTIGTGVIARSIIRARDQFLDSQVRNGLSEQATQQAQRDALKEVEDAFGEPSDHGINSALGKLFQNFGELVNNPEDLGVRATVVQSANALARTFQGVQDRLAGVGQQVASRISSGVDTVNAYGKQIAALNVTIRQATSQNVNANDLMDRRDFLLDKLAGLANVSVINRSDGTVNVSVGASDLVQGADSFGLSVSGPNGLAARGDVSGGDLGGLLQAQADLNGYRGDLDNLAASLITTVNAQHRAGAGLDGSSGTDFFTGTTAAAIAVNPALVAQPEKLAAAAAPAGGGAPPPGDASNADAISSLQNAPVANLGGKSLPEFFQERVSSLGGLSAAAKTAVASAGANLDQLTQQRDSVTGVSTDAEMVNMLKFQRAYEASARVVKTMDEMLGTLINGLFAN